MKPYLLLFLVFLIQLPLLAQPPTSFREGKKQAAILYQKLYQHPQKSKTFYCRCPYNKLGMIEGGCVFKGAKKLSWEHLIPAEKLGQALGVWPYKVKKNWLNADGSKWITPTVCFSKKGKKLSNRRCARKLSETFKKAEGDLYNLVPSVLKLNIKRRSYDFVSQPLPKNAACMMVVLGKGKNKKAHVSQKIQGNIARVYLHMNQQYFGATWLSEDAKKKFKNWSHLDPPTQLDCKREALIKEATGGGNDFVAVPCKQQGLTHLVMNQ